MKVFFTLCFTLTSLFVFAQAPVNDDCSGLIDLGVIPYCSMPALYTNVNATASNISATDNIPACFNNNAERDVWFQFTVPSDGSILDVSISVYGNVNGNGTLQMPEVAIYRGDCVLEGLAELDCATAAINVNEVHLDQFGLTPGLPYFLRINDYSATAAANAGTFRLCIEKYVPEINIGTVPGTQSCTGTLYDSGGPTNDYSSDDNATFTICPTEFHQCIILNVVNYETESGYDYLHIFEGNGLTGNEITQLSGFGQNLEIQVPGSCATIQFVADNFLEYSGFEITWVCSTSPCTAPPITTCDVPVSIPDLPYSASNLSNCLSGNTINDGPCDDDFLAGNDYIFSYTSPGDECIHIDVNGTNPGAGIGVYSLCPSLAGATCIATAGGGGGSIDPTIQAAYLENPGTYYLVFGSGGDCSPFNIQIDTITCPVIVPAASSCDKALNIGGCSNLLPEIIALNPGEGDPSFLQPGVNAGCFLNSPGNFSFFYFTAGADGKFGFIAQAADPLETSDIDFSMWGPIDSTEDICNYVTNNQPVRSSWAAYENPAEVYITGMADVHPDSGLPVTDNFDCGSPDTPGPNPPSGAQADDFVSRLDVQEGKIYVILLDDFGNSIEQGGIAMDFTGTTDGVLNALDSQISVTEDTAVCLGQPVQLTATGGVAYFWSPSTGLSCSNCQSPLATINASTSYEVQVVTACKTVTQVVNIKALQINLGPDVTVCNGASFQLNPNPFNNVEYSWIGGNFLSCTDCPSPQVSGLTTGIYIFIATLTTPQCVVMDTIKITVVNGQQPQYVIADDQIICKGESVDLGGAQVPGTFYLWTSSPEGLTSSVSNPNVSPNATTTYYLSATNGSCPVSAIDSVHIEVFKAPILAVQADTAVCDGSTVLLATTVAQPGITYAWTPDNGSLDNADSPNPLATPLQTTLYTLTATNPGCTEIRKVQVVIVPLSLDLSVGDTALICLGKSLPIQATVTPGLTQISWSPLTNLQINANGTSAIASPNESTLYTAKVVLPGCTREKQVYVQVDSLPKNLAILPADTSVCQGSKVILRSAIYEPAEFKNIEFQWSPLIGQVTGDSLFNLVVQPDVTTVYQRITTNSGCVQTDSVTVTVIPPAEMNIQPADTTICAGQNVLLLLTFTPGITEIMWTPAESLSCSTCTNPIATPGTTTTYNVTGKFQGCKTDASATVNVRLTAAYHFPDDRMLCAGESIQLSDVSEPDATYIWTSTDPAFGTVTTPQPIVTPTLATTTYFLQTDNGCPRSDQFVVTVNTGSMQASGDTTICKGVSTKLTAISTVPGTYEWSQGAGIGQVVNVMPDTSTTYQVTFTFGPGCQLTDLVTVNVAGEIAPVVFPTDLKLCPAESITLNSVPVPGASYMWSSVPTGFNSTQPNPSVTPDVTTLYTVVSTLGNCVNTQTVTVIVDNAVLTVSDDATLCLGNSLTLTANGTFPGGSYLWSPVPNSTASIEVQPVVTGISTYAVNYSYGDGCMIKDTVNVTTIAGFTVEILATPDTSSVNLGETIDLFGKVSPSQNLSGFLYTWMEGNAVLNQNTEKITVKPEDADSVTYKVTIVAPSGCSETATISFRIIQPNVVFPNAFTPNGDGVNGTFKMLVLEGLATVEQMEIYNRWGQKVFTSSDPNAEWDGRVDGKDAPSDVYACKVRWRRGDGSLKIYVGEISLLR